MAFTAYRTWVVGEIVTKAMLDEQIKENGKYLKGQSGAITLENSLILPDGAGFYIHIPNLTTVQRDALTPTAGMLIYNTTTTQFNKYENGAWRADLGFNSHHGDLSGLTDDDHTQYQKESLLTTAGDIPYATADSTWARLGIGTASQFLRVNGAATAPEWGTSGLTFIELAGGEDHAVGANDTWTDWDISAIVPAGTLSVLVGSFGGATNLYTRGARKNGSALSRLQANVYGYSWTMLQTECDANRVIELYGSNAAVVFSILGYWI